MPLPDFTADEQVLISSVRSSRNVTSNSYMWGYMVTGMLMGWFAAHYDSIPMMGCAFVVVCGFRLYEEWQQVRWLPVWRSILNKYEAAVVPQKSPET